MGHAQNLVAAGLIGLACIGESRGDSFTLDLTTTSRPQFPVWMPERPLAAPKPQAELSFAVVPGSEDDDLALTVVFQEEVGGFLSVYWEDSSGNRQLLAPNLFEHIGLPNQRTLLIKRPTMGGPGKIILKSSREVLNVLRVRLDWARPGVVRLVDNVPNGALIANGGKMYAPEEVDGTTLTPIADSWEAKILTTSVTDQADRIENGIDYSIAIPDKVERARIELLVNGLQLDQTLILWLNGRACGPIALEIPDLTDPGYDKASSGIAHFIGWRKGTFLLQGEQLIVGDNHFQFQTPPNSQVAIRDFLIQVEYASN